MAESSDFACGDFWTEFRIQRPSMNARKLRLFICACCRRVWDQCNSKRCQEAIEVAEKFADGTTGFDELTKARNRAMDKLGRSSNFIRRRQYSEVVHEQQARLAAVACACQDLDEVAQGLKSVAAIMEWSEILLVLRDITGCPSSASSRVGEWLYWNAGSILRLAHSIYGDYSFTDMPLLADMREEAGCDDVDILAHCRGVGPHVRGCWVLDLLLGK